MSNTNKPDFEPQANVDWFNPILLLKIGIKTVISSLFGSFMDKREMQAAIHQTHGAKFFDYSGQEDIWVDYVADLAEGFHPTYTVAYLLAKDSLTLDGEEAPKAEVIIMGGDEVYPAADREEYKNRLKGPYKYAFLKNATQKYPKLFAIPGNHDWYDGLTNFLKIFTQGRKIGHLQTEQHRSYFAIKLPHNIWIFGIDIQLDADVDWNQIEYFKEVMKHKDFEDGSRVILCTAEPSWIYSTRADDHSYKNLCFFEKYIVNDPKRDIKQILTLAGDIHNYCCYSAGDDVYKIHAGGGGAFLHPTHNLPDLIENVREGKLTIKGETFPKREDSKALAWYNFLFTFKHLRFSIFLGVLFALEAWMLQIPELFNSSATPITDASFCHTLKNFFYNPAALIIGSLLVVGAWAFAEKDPYKPLFKKKWIYHLIGVTHGFVQLAILLICHWLLGSSNKLFIDGNFALLLLAFFIIGFFIGSTVFGIYLVISNRFLRTHDNEAFSALENTNYKNFLRIHIKKGVLTIYPVAIKKTSKWKYASTSETFIPDKEPEYAIIGSKLEIPF